MVKLSNLALGGRGEVWLCKLSYTTSVAATAGGEGAGVVAVADRLL